MNKIIVDSNSGFKKIRPFIAKIIKNSFRVLNKNNLALEVYLIKDAEIKRLNRLFRGKNKAANVLSFKAPPKFPRPDIRSPFRYLGEIYLAPHYIKTQKDDIRRLAIHGLLHLLGYTHNKKNDTIKMQRQELKLMKIVTDK